MDGEVDAFLILALSVEVAPSAGVWVLAIGAARYAFLAAGWAFTWMRAPLPRRDWRKVVTAVQGITLTVAAAEILPPALTRAAPRGRPRPARRVVRTGRLVAVAAPRRGPANSRGARSQPNRRHPADACSRSLVCGSRWSLRAGRGCSRPAHSSGSRSKVIVVLLLAVLLPTRARRAPRVGDRAGARRCWCW